MRSKLGTVFMVLGVLLLCASAALFLYNQSEATQAQQSSQELMPQLIRQIPTQPAQEDVPPEAPVPKELLDPSELKMTEVKINGYAYIGYLSLPTLGLELPILADWDYRRLQIAPCRYMGTVKGEDLVLMAHNYPLHFGQISNLSVGDSVLFTDMDGEVTAYEVAARDILAATAVEEMTSGDFPLTLFTCTYGGKSRVTVFCSLRSDG